MSRDEVLETVAATAQPTLMEMLDYAEDEDNVPGSPWLREPLYRAILARSDRPELLVGAALNPALDLSTVVRLLEHSDPDVAEAAGENPSLPLQLRTRPYARLLHPDCPSDEVVEALSGPWGPSAFAAARHPNLPADVRAEQVAHGNRLVLRNPRLTQAEVEQRLGADTEVVRAWSRHPNADPDWLSAWVRARLDVKDSYAQTGAFSDLTYAAANPAVLPADLTSIYDRNVNVVATSNVLANPSCPFDVVVSALVQGIDRHGGVALRRSLCHVLTRRTSVADRLLDTTPTRLLPSFHQHVPSILTFAAARATTPGQAAAILKLAPEFAEVSLADLLHTTSALAAGPEAAEGEPAVGASPSARVGR